MLLNFVGEKTRGGLVNLLSQNWCMLSIMNFIPLTCKTFSMLSM